MSTKDHFVKETSMARVQVQTVKKSEVKDIRKDKNGEIADKLQQARDNSQFKLRSTRNKKSVKDDFEYY